MAIAFPVSMPLTPGFTISSWGNEDVTNIQMSSFTGATKKLERFNSVWMADLTLPQMAEADGRRWAGFLMSLRGQTGTFYCWDPDAEQPLGTVNGTLTGTASARSRSLTLTGAAGTLKIGDYLQIGNEYKMVVEDWDAGIGGPVSVEPFFRENHSGSPVVYDNPKGVFRLASDERRWDVNEMCLYGITFSIIEDFT